MAHFTFHIHKYSKISPNFRSFLAELAAESSQMLASMFLVEVVTLIDRWHLVGGGASEADFYTTLKPNFIYLVIFLIIQIWQGG